MEFDLFGMGDFSFDDMAYDVLCLGPISKEKGFAGEAVWQSILLSPLGYEVCLVDSLENEAESEWLQKEAKAYGIYTTKEIEKEAEKCKVISVSELFAEGMMELTALKNFLIIGKENNVKICVDPGSFTDVEKAKEVLRELAPYIDYFIPNEEEAKLLSGQNIPPMIAQEFMEMGMKNVIITMGMNGCFVKGDGAPFAMGAIWGETKDLIGVGANFSAGIVHGLFQDWQMKTICEFATGCAAVSAMYETPIDGAKTRKDQIKKILNNPYI
ncbi:MAG: carbohydrate kinase family protein [Eubacteriales bacterium]|nr:carbohydrate kinase family protein [Eubacteriales bacterium]